MFSISPFSFKNRTETIFKKQKILLLSYSQGHALSAKAIVSLTNPNAIGTGLGNRKLLCRNAVAKPSSRYLLSSSSSSSLMEPSPLASRFPPLIVPTRSFKLRYSGDSTLSWSSKVKMKVEVLMDSNPSEMDDIYFLRKGTEGKIQFISLDLEV